MDYEKIGGLIRSLRLEQGLTQLQLAVRLGISDKAVSKWERGMGCPDVSLLPHLSQTLGVELESLLTGELGINDEAGGTMKHLQFYVCPHCGNLICSWAEAGVTCCGKKLAPTVPQKTEGSDRLAVEQIENDYYVTADLPMSKDHYIRFLALLTGETLVLRRLYPEWDLQVRLPRVGHGRLLWFCTQHGLFQQLV